MTGTEVQPATPLRSVPFVDRDGCRELSRQPVEYRDGSEAAVLDIVDRCSDLSSTSMELELAATTIGELYHLSRARSNVLRALSLPPGARVLEIGAGCGAITRYLGETCALVDSIEPMVDRARAARRRTADLDSVEVYVGGLEDVPDVAAYDVALFCGVLEYLADGSADPAPYVDVLTRARRLVRPGGIVACAIENKLGAKYVAGAREDHTSRPFDGLEDYPRGTRARTFPRAALEAMFRDAGLEPRVLHLFPDYKATRVAMADDLLSTAPDLARRLPIFPSVDWWGQQGWQVADEARVWRTLVDAGLGSETANSFLVLGHVPGSDRLAVWDDAAHAAYINLSHRSTAFGRRSAVVARHDGTHHVRRELLAPGTTARVGLLELRALDEPVHTGEMLVDLVTDPARAGDADRALRAWASELASLVDESLAAGRPIPIDHAPHNVIVAPDGALQVIDQEWWWHGPATATDVALLGLFALAQTIARATPTELQRDGTVESLVRELAARAGVEVGTAEWGSARAFMASVHAHVAPRLGPPTAEDVDDVLGIQDEQLARQVHDVRRSGFGGATALAHDLEVYRSEYEHALAHARAMEARVEDLEQRLAATELDSRQQRERAEAAERFNHSIVESRGWRALEALRRLVRRSA